MAKIDIFSGFLGAGKTTLIKKLIAEGAYGNEKLVLIENEFGEIGIDGGFLQDAGISITEMNSGCICCSLVGDFGRALEKVIAEYAPDRILIEPSGVGKLSDVIAAVKKVETDSVRLCGCTAVVDAKKCRMYMKNFGEFFINQVKHAVVIVLSHTEGMSEERISSCIDALREHNAGATIITTPWGQLTGAQILSTIDRRGSLYAELERLAEETCARQRAEEHAHHHEHGDDCDCEECHGHHHDHDHHDHHDHDHDHHHEHDDDCDCEECREHHHDHEHHGHGHHDHDHGHHHHHHADDVFSSWGKEFTRAFDQKELSKMLKALDGGSLGTVLRAKGIVPQKDSEAWLHFDYIPGEVSIREGSAEVTGRLCVIGTKLNEEKLASLFGV